MLGYGVVIVLAAWLAGKGAIATGIRRWLTPVLRPRGVAYACLAGLFFLILLWNPTPATSRLLPSLVLLALLIAGMEALRAKAIKEFPDETADTARQRLRDSASGLRRSPAPAAAPLDPEAARVDALERVGKLHQSGVLDDEEFAAEKKRLLAKA